MAPATATMSVLLELRKYLMRMAILAATVTYVAELTPLTGHRRYNAFYYSKASAFTTSVVVILLLLLMERSIGKSNRRHVVAALRVVIVLDLFAVLVAYAAGASRGRATTVPASLLFFAVSVYITGYAAYRALFRPRPPDQSPSDASVNLRIERRRKILMLFWIFVSTVAYTAGLSPPGSFWPDSREGYRPGSPVLEDRHHPWRSIAFFVCNTVAFIASLRGIMLLTTIRSKFKDGDGNGRWLYVLYRHVVLALSGLLVAYAFSNVYIFGQVFIIGMVFLIGLVFLFGLVCLFGLVYPGLAYSAIKYIIQRYWRAMLVYLAHKIKRRLSSHWTSLSSRLRSCWSNTSSSRTDPDEQSVGQEQRDHGTETPDQAKRPNTAVLLLVTLAATITYQAAMNPPGGFWTDSRDGHAKSYKVFFAFNSLALMTSIVVIPMVLTRHATSAVLDLLSLLVAYAVGCGQAVKTSVRVVTLGGGILVCVVIDIVFFTLKSTRRTPELLKKKRKLLLLFAILVITITCQDGLTQPDGFWLEDAGGYTVLAKIYPHRYSAFFYCNAASFMSSVAIIILLMNPHMYELGIMCHSLYLCAVSALFGLIGPYVAGSSHRVRTSLYVVKVGLGLLLWLTMVFVFIVLLLLAIKFLSRCKIFCRGSTELPRKPQEGGGDKDRQPQEEEAVEPQPRPQRQRQRGGGNHRETAEYTTRKYLMLVSILVASVTYQAAGLIPPGG